MSQPATWYSVVIDVPAGHPPEPPFTQVWEGTADEVADRIVALYGLTDIATPWHVRVYADYNRFDDLLAERSGGKR